ncbi:hypothetical protein B0T18DRAFT_322887 [Schizothecium vesticola]|uniref:Meiotically up-regulated gene 190 protein n=1 Tax=Schizothecium vesticola TaxID=314040 RepID=A0AA40K7L6_9PEZI|nr:hypothetical protein B0T18DRAFT_322887 [Schizothecium vesticola]
MDDFEDRGPRKAHGGPYTSKHPVPTIKGYREHRAELKRRDDETDAASTYADEQEDGPTESKTKRAYESVKAIAAGQDQQQTQHDPYPTSNRNAHGPPQPPPEADADVQDGTSDDDSEHETNSHRHRPYGSRRKKDDENKKSATETAAATIDPREKRKAMKKSHPSHAGRPVTDPVTHLPVTIHDMTDNHLHACPENKAGAEEDHRALTGISCESKSRSQISLEKEELDRGLKGMRMLFPPPNFEDTKKEMMRTYRTAIWAGLAGMAAVGVLAVGLILGTGTASHRSGGWFGRSDGWSNAISATIILALASGGVFALVTGITGWLSRKVNDIFEEEVWDSARRQEVESNQSEVEMPESVAWLNGMLASVWRLINPDLFAGLVDTLEDVMQASLPKVIRMVSVDDIGQGNEAFRILGVRWLPTGAAGQSVDTEGNVKPAKGNDRTVGGDRDSQAGESNASDDQQSAQNQQSIQEGMEAEEGDFVNVELAFAYRARSSGKSIKSKAKNAHLYLKFYLPGGIAVPVWVELRGLVGIMRLRLQLTPDPPFFDLCTITFLGQPRADLSCVPLSKHSLNLMDVPLISSFVQSAIDAALAEYVAPKSLTLQLKDMLIGDDFKKDTLARGVLLVHIKRARDFKQGDGGLGPLKDGSSDSYVSVSWGKFGKPVASTRIILGEQEPDWNEWASVLVTPDEINAEETLRLQLWDSDKHTADDDLGRVEMTLKELMHGDKTRNRMWDREDGLRAEDPDETMPGTLTWSVGYFSKAHIQQCQLDKQTFDPSLRRTEDVKTRVSENAHSKLREAFGASDMSKELRQQESQDYKELEDSMITSAPPPDGLPSGILAIQIHNITGLEVAKLNRNRDRGAGDGEDREDEAERSDELPDSYCTIILNHRKIYRTRTKPKNAKPFFNAGTERFVKDWRAAEVIVSVRDSREGENDPLLGVIYLPLRRVFETRSQVMATYPLAGGVGYGRARISMVWRSVEIKMPRELTGWDYGTLEVRAPVKAVGAGAFPAELKGAKLKFKTKIDKAKMYSGQGGEPEGTWGLKSKSEEEGVFAGVIKRYATSLIVEFRNSAFVSEDKAAFAVLWLGDIPDEEEKTVTLKVWKGGKAHLRRARSCAGYSGIEEGEQPLGEIEMTVRFWRGLSGYHKAYASKAKNSDVKGVMEVLDTVNDEKMAEDDDEDFDSSTESSSSDSDSDSDDDEFGGPRRQDSQAEAEKRKRLRKAGESSSESGTDNEGGGGIKAAKRLPSKVKARAATKLEGKGGSDDDGKRGPVSQVQDYKRHHKQLHRKHRGVMQWKATRSLDWMATKVKNGAGRVGGLMRHEDKEQGVETEV